MVRGYETSVQTRAHHQEHYTHWNVSVNRLCMSNGGMHRHYWFLSQAAVQLQLTRLMHHAACCRDLKQYDDVLAKGRSLVLA